MIIGLIIMKKYCAENVFNTIVFCLMEFAYGTDFLGANFALENF